jgi:glycine cleavage system aminomethyltransferase T
MARLIAHNTPVDIHPGDSVLTAMLRAGVHPTGGGCICHAGDCPHCLATVDGVSYVRTCQTPAKPGMVVAGHTADGYPDLPNNAQIGQVTPAVNVFADVVVIGQGESGTAAAAQARAQGKYVITFDATHGQEVVAIWPGPVVVARTPEGMVHAHVHDEIVVATGAAELQPVAPGNQLAGIVTARAAERLTQAGVALGRVIAIGTAPAGVDATVVEGALVRFEGGDRVSAVIVRGADGRETRHHCDTVSIGLGLHPRTALSRMASGLPVRVVGDAALAPSLPTCPAAGTVCACSNVTVEDLQFAWDHGFREMELFKRSTLAGTGTCQGMGCIPHMRAFLEDRGGKPQPPFTARPLNRAVTMGEISAGAVHRATPRTALDAEHRALGAYMDRVGTWWRPYNYGPWQAEYWAVREAVSLGDVSTLGKIQVCGPDALEFLERLYPTTIHTIKPGRAKYVLILDDRGYVMDDGLVCNDGDGRYTLTFTSGGASNVEMWLRDWADSWKMDLRLLNQTMSLGAINVTGPLAIALMGRAGVDTPPAFMNFAHTNVAGVPCRVYRMSFTGEVSFELHHPAEHSVALWRTLMDLGRDLGIKPHGIEALLKLRLEKGHIIVGQDSDFDSTPRRLNHDWAVKMDKPFFVGKQALLRTNAIPLDKQLCALEMDGPAPAEGSLIRHIDAPVSGAIQPEDYAGYVTSSTWSPVLGKTVMLGWVRLREGALPDRVLIQGREAVRSTAPFYDKEGARAKG